MARMGRARSRTARWTLPATCGMSSGHRVSPDILEVRRRSNCNRCIDAVIPADRGYERGCVEVPACTLRTELLRSNRPTCQGGGCVKNQWLGRSSHLVRRGTGQASQCATDARIVQVQSFHVSFRDTRGVPGGVGISSGSRFFGLYLTDVRLQITLESVEQRSLIGMDDPPRARDLDELGLVDFPRC